MASRSRRDSSTSRSSTPSRQSPGALEDGKCKIIRDPRTVRECIKLDDRSLPKCLRREVAEPVAQFLEAIESIELPRYTLGIRNTIRIRSRRVAPTGMLMCVR